MPVWNPEDALDAFRVSNAYLDVRFAPKTGRWIKPLAFHEHRTDGVEWKISRFFSNLVKVVDDHTV